MLSQPKRGQTGNIAGLTLGADALRCRNERPAPTPARVVPAIGWRDMRSMTSEAS